MNGWSTFKLINMIILPLDINHTSINIKWCLFCHTAYHRCVWIFSVVCNDSKHFTYFYLTPPTCIYTNIIFMSRWGHLYIAEAFWHVIYLNCSTIQPVKVIALLDKTQLIENNSSQMAWVIPNTLNYRKLAKCLFLLQNSYLLKCPTSNR